MTHDEYIEQTNDLHPRRTGARWRSLFTAPAVAVLPLLAMSCGGNPSSEALETGELNSALELSDVVHDVTSVHTKVVEGDDCDAEAVAEKTTPVEEEALPQNLQPDGGGDNHPFADALFVLSPGDYGVCVTPLAADGSASTECAPASDTATVTPGETTEILLISQCDGEQTGGLDAITALNDPPIVDDISIRESKFITTCEEAVIEVSASDPNGDELSVSFEITDGEATSSLSADGSTAVFSASAVGDYEVTITVTDIYGASSTFSFPIHVSPCPDETPCMGDAECDAGFVCVDGECVERCADCEPASIWINEIHYDNEGADQDEGIEIAGPGGTLLDGWELQLVNGNGGAVYLSAPLSGTLPGADFGFLWVPIAGLQNGAPDGIVLVRPDATVEQFLSYEGTVEATDGAAAGMFSDDILVVEEGITPLGTSMQLEGAGSEHTDFVWRSQVQATPGSVNIGQVLL